MERSKICFNKFNLIKKEVNMYAEKDIINEEQKEKILNLYEIDEMNFVKLILMVGSILIGLGVLSFIASNWQAISKSFKLIIILFGMIATYVSGYLIQDKYFKTGRSLIYISTFIYGAGIFLIDQMFNLDTYISNSFLIWLIGILPIALIFKDEFLFVFANILALVFINTHFRYYNLFIVPFIITVSLYLLNRYFNYSKIVTFINNIILVLLAIHICKNDNLNILYTTIIVLIVGLIMYFYDFKINKKIFKIEGSLIIGITGIILTFENTWSILSKSLNPQVLSIIFTIVFIVFLLYLTKKGNLLSFIFVFVTILRYYFDTFYDFMPKSIFFFIGGTILLAFGYYLEKLRKIKGEVINED